MTTKDASMVRADETKPMENGPSTAAAAAASVSVGDDLGANRNRAKPSDFEVNINSDCQTGKVDASEHTATTETPVFRMKLHVPSQQHVRKRKRSVTVGGGAAAAASSLNVFGDEEDETKISRTHKLLTMSMSGSSSSSDEEDDPSHSKTGSSNKDTTVDSDVENYPESRRPQHEIVRSSSGNHGNDNINNANNNAQDAQVQNDSENKSSKIVEEHVVTGANNGDSTSTEIDTNHSQKDHIPPNNESQQQQQEQQHQFQHQRQQQQPEGWRVKLYRLNADGSWDDCGTGRILCLYKPKPPPSAQNTDHKNDSPTAKNITNVSGNNSNSKNNDNNESNLSSYNSQSNNSDDPNSDSAIYVELGEPTLCMHSENSNAANRNNNTSPSIQQQPSINHRNNITNSNENNTGNAYNNPRILLRTRILLRDAYQRQGDNIITWCEPYLEEGNPAQGVDLALSFQDNAGCIDIWRQITQVQSKANEKFRLRQQQQQNTNTSGNSSGTKVSGGALENNQSHGRSLADLAHNMATALRPNLHQQQQELWANAAAETGQGQPPNGNVNDHNSHLSSSSNNNNDNNINDDHHAFEDAMGGIVAAYRDAAGGSTNTNALGGGGQLPNPPTVEALEDITDTIATVQVRNIRFENFSISEKRKKQTQTCAFVVF